MSIPRDLLEFPVPKRFRGKTESVWNEYAKIRMEYQVINLGSGFADYSVTKEFNAVLGDVVAIGDNSLNQYARTFVRTLYFDRNFTHTIGIM